MADFPRLKTGAIAQYPAEADVSWKTHVVRFLDGSEQRHQQIQNPVSRWIVRVELLDDQEARTLADFYREQSGMLGTFSFEDPNTNVVYPSCSFEVDHFSVIEEDEFRNSGMLRIRTVA